MGNEKIKYVPINAHAYPQTGFEKFVQVLKRSIKLELLNGLRITFMRMIHTLWGKEQHTFLYPLEKMEMYPRYRAIHQLYRLLESNNERCIGCGLCEKICISNCIRMETRYDEEGRKEVGEYSINLGRCIYCGYCAEVCPELAIVHSGRYENSSEQRAYFAIKEDMLTPIDKMINQKEFEGYGAISPNASSNLKKTPLAY